MALVRIPVQPLQVLDNTSTQRIKVQISNKLQKVWFLLAYYRLEAVLPPARRAYASERNTCP